MHGREEMVSVVRAPRSARWFRLCMTIEYLEMVCTEYAHRMYYLVVNALRDTKVPNAGSPALPSPWPLPNIDSPGRCLTRDVELFIGDLSLQINPPPLLCVIHSAEARDVDHTLLVNIHVAGCESKKQRGKVGHMGSHHCLRVLLSEQTWGWFFPNVILCYNVFGDMNC